MDSRQTLFKAMAAALVVVLGLSRLAAVDGRQPDRLRARLLLVEVVELAALGQRQLGQRIREVVGIEVEHLLVQHVHHAGIAAVRQRGAVQQARQHHRPREVQQVLQGDAGGGE